MKNKLTNKDYIIIGKMWEMDSHLSKYRVIAALKLGRPVRKEEVVHHANHNHNDDNPNNLIVCKNAFEHRSLHKLKKNKKLVNSRPRKEILGNKANKRKLQLQEFIKKSGFKQYDIANILNISESLISRYVSGDRTLSEREEEKISKILDCNLKLINQFI